MARKVKGVSEMLAAIILIAITLAGFGFVTATVAPRFANQGASVLEIIHKNQEALGQMATVVYAVEQGGVVYSYIYNFGTVPITPELVFVNNQPYTMGNAFLVAPGATIGVSYGNSPTALSPLPGSFAVYNNAREGGITMVFYANFTNSVTFNVNFDDGGDIFYKPVGSSQWHAVFGQWTRGGPLGAQKTISVAPGEYEVAIDYYLDNPGVTINVMITGLSGVTSPLSAIGWNMSSTWDGNANELYTVVSENPADPVGGSGSNQIIYVTNGEIPWNVGAPSQGNENYFFLTFLNGTPTQDIPPHTVVRLTLYLPQSESVKIDMLTTAGQMYQWNVTA